jgi:hypothetical protein
MPLTQANTLIVPVIITGNSAITSLTDGALILTVTAHDVTGTGSGYANIFNNQTATADVIGTPVFDAQKNTISYNDTVPGTASVSSPLLQNTILTTNVNSQGNATLINGLTVNFSDLTANNNAARVITDIHAIRVISDVSPVNTPTVQTNITNYYGLRLGYNNTFGKATVAKAWGVYQTGIVPRNFFEGRTIIGAAVLNTPVDDGANKLQVIGDGKITGNLVVTGTVSGTVAAPGTTLQVLFNNAGAQATSANVMLSTDLARVLLTGATDDAVTAVQIAGALKNTTTITAGTALIVDGNPAATGAVRLPTNTSIVWRNNANTGDVIGLTMDSSDRLSINTGAGTNMQISVAAVPQLKVSSSVLAIQDTVNVSTSSTVGTKFGTATNQKIGFYNAAPIAQRSGAAQAAAAVTAATNVTPFGYTTAAQADAIVTLVNELRAWAVSQGFIKGSA